jgi:hypothetical protein
LPRRQRALTVAVYRASLLVGQMATHGANPSSPTSLAEREGVN